VQVHTDGEQGAVIIAAETGDIYENQVGGYGCYHPQCEGYAIPVTVPDAIRRRLDEGYGGWCCHGINDEDADIIDATNILDGMKVDWSKLRDAMEAWVPVLYNGLQGWLTWENSD